ncbi:MAG: MbnP family protein [Bacteroidia bacterium]|nr:MbnP family protein [Bacteroidia bacterium]
MMKNLRPILSLFYLASVLLACQSCKEDPPPKPDPGIGLFELNIVPRVGGQLFQKNDDYFHADGRKFEFHTAKIFISDLTLYRADGWDTVIHSPQTNSEVMLFNFGEDEIRKTSHGEGLFKFFTVPAGDYDGAKISFGVPPRYNHTDPLSYPSNNPLNSAYLMHENTTLGYAFVHLAGNIDTSPNMSGALLDGPFEYFIGGDALFNTLTFRGGDYVFTVPKNAELQYTIEIDLNRLFYTPTDTVDIMNDHVPDLSSNPTLSAKIMDNFIQGAIYKPPF